MGLIQLMILEIWLGGISDWLEWLDDLATSLETDMEEEEEEGTRMVIGLQDSQGKLMNGTEEQGHFASSLKPRRKRPSEASYDFSFS